jgi:purine-binding chemotaxis protein CheW
MSSNLFLIAHLAGRAIAIDSDHVESAVDLGSVTPVPRAVAPIRGLTALRSRVVTVIDTPAALGLPPASEARRAIITQVDGHQYALLVDTLEDVAPFALRPLASGVALEGAWAEVARGEVEREGEPVLAVDLRALIPSLVAAA